jgi:hypothetical protein
MSKPSRLPAIAGTLAGLLAAALGAWYLYPQHVGPATAPAGATAPSSARSAAPAAAAPARQLTGQLTRDQAVDRLMALPELQAWARSIETASHGAVHGAVIPFDPALRELHGKRYHQLSFVENRPDAAVTWESFLVGAADGEILVDDPESGNAVPLDQWRRTKRPMERSAR